MPLIHRYATSSDYAVLLSTAPRARKHPRSQTWLSQRSEKVLAETAAWHEALFPPLHELQAVLQRMRTDPDLSQGSIFRFCAPLLVFFCLVVLFVVVTQVSKAHLAALRMLDAPEMHKRELMSAATAIGGGVVGGVIILRVVIWAGASAIGIFVRTKLAKADTKDSSTLSEASVLGGIFTGVLLLS